MPERPPSKDPAVRRTSVHTHSLASTAPPTPSLRSQASDPSDLHRGVRSENARGTPGAGAGGSAPISQQPQHPPRHDRQRSSQHSTAHDATLHRRSKDRNGLGPAPSTSSPSPTWRHGKSGDDAGLMVTYSGFASAPGLLSGEPSSPGFPGSGAQQRSSSVKVPPSNMLSGPRNLLPRSSSSTAHARGPHQEGGGEEGEYSTVPTPMQVRRFNMLANPYMNPVYDPTRRPFFNTPSTRVRERLDMAMAARQPSAPAMLKNFSLAEIDESVSKLMDDYDEQRQAEIARRADLDAEKYCGDDSDGAEDPFEADPEMRPATPALNPDHARPTTREGRGKKPNGGSPQPRYLTSPHDTPRKSIMDQATGAGPQSLPPASPVLAAQRLIAQQRARRTLGLVDNSSEDDVDVVSSPRRDHKRAVAQHKSEVAKMNSQTPQRQRAAQFRKDTEEALRLRSKPPALAPTPALQSQNPSAFSSTALAPSGAIGHTAVSPSPSAATTALSPFASSTASVTSGGGGGRRTRVEIIRQSRVVKADGGFRAENLPDLPVDEDHRYHEPEPEVPAQEPERELAKDVEDLLAQPPATLDIFPPREPSVSSSDSDNATLPTASQLLSMTTSSSKKEPRQPKLPKYKAKGGGSPDRGALTPTPGPAIDGQNSRDDRRPASGARGRQRTASGASATPTNSDAVLTPPASPGINASAIDPAASSQALSAGQRDDERSPRKFRPAPAGTYVQVYGRPAGARAVSPQRPSVASAGGGPGDVPLPPVMQYRGVGGAFGSADGGAEDRDMSVPLMRPDSAGVASDGMRRSILRPTSRDRDRDSTTDGKSIPGLRRPGSASVVSLQSPLQDPNADESATAKGSHQSAEHDDGATATAGTASVAGDRERAPGLAMSVSFFREDGGTDKTATRPTGSPAERGDELLSARGSSAQRRLSASPRPTSGRRPSSAASMNSARSAGRSPEHTPARDPALLPSPNTPRALQNDTAPNSSREPYNRRKSATATLSTIAPMSSALPPKATTSGSVAGGAKPHRASEAFSASSGGEEVFTPSRRKSSAAGGALSSTGSGGVTPTTSGGGRVGSAGSARRHSRAKDAALPAGKQVGSLSHVVKVGGGGSGSGAIVEYIDESPGRGWMGSLRQSGIVVVSGGDSSSGAVSPENSVGASAARRRKSSVKTLGYESKLLDESAGSQVEAWAKDEYESPHAGFTSQPVSMRVRHTKGNEVQTQTGGDDSQRPTSSSIVRSSAVESQQQLRGRGATNANARATSPQARSRSRSPAASPGRSARSVSPSQVPSDRPPPKAQGQTSQKTSERHGKVYEHQSVTGVLPPSVAKGSTAEGIIGARVIGVRPSSSDRDRRDRRRLEAQEEQKRKAEAEKVAAAATAKASDRVMADDNDDDGVENDPLAGTRAGGGQDRQQSLLDALRTADVAPQPTQSTAGDANRHGRGRPGRKLRNDPVTNDDDDDGTQYATPIPLDKEALAFLSAAESDMASNTASAAIERALSASRPSSPEFVDVGTGGRARQRRNNRGGAGSGYFSTTTAAGDSDLASTTASAAIEQAIMIRSREVSPAAATRRSRHHSPQRHGDDADSADDERTIDLGEGEHQDQDGGYRSDLASTVASAAIDAVVRSREASPSAKRRNPDDRQSRDPRSSGPNGDDGRDASGRVNDDEGEGAEGAGYYSDLASTAASAAIERAVEQRSREASPDARTAGRCRDDQDDDHEEATALTTEAADDGDDDAAKGTHSRDGTKEVPPPAEAEQSAHRPPTLSQLPVSATQSPPDEHFQDGRSTPVALTPASLRQNAELYKRRHVDDDGLRQLNDVSGDGDDDARLGGRSGDQNSPSFVIPAIEAGRGGRAKSGGKARRRLSPRNGDDDAGPTPTSTSDRTPTRHSQRRPESPVAPNESPIAFLSGEDDTRIAPPKEDSGAVSPSRGARRRLAHPPLHTLDQTRERKERVRRMGGDREVRLRLSTGDEVKVIPQYGFAHQLTCDACHADAEKDAVRRRQHENHAEAQYRKAVAADEQRTRSVLYATYMQDKAVVTKVLRSRSVQDTNASLKIEKAEAQARKKTQAAGQLWLAAVKDIYDSVFRPIVFGIKEMRGYHQAFVQPDEDRAERRREYRRAKRDRLVAAAHCKGGVLAGDMSLGASLMHASPAALIAEEDRLAKDGMPAIGTPAQLQTVGAENDGDAFHDMSSIHTSEISDDSYRSSDDDTSDSTVSSDEFSLSSAAARHAKELGAEADEAGIQYHIARRSTEAIRQHRRRQTIAARRAERGHVTPRVISARAATHDIGGVPPDDSDFLLGATPRKTNKMVLPPPSSAAHYTSLRHLTYSSGPAADTLYRAEVKRDQGRYYRPPRHIPDAGYRPELSPLGSPAMPSSPQNAIGGASRMRAHGGGSGGVAAFARNPSVVNSFANSAAGGPGVVMRPSPRRITSAMDDGGMRSEDGAAPSPSVRSGSAGKRGGKSKTDESSKKIESKKRGLSQSPSRPVSRQTAGGPSPPRPGSTLAVDAQITLHREPKFFTPKRASILDERDAQRAAMEFAQETDDTRARSPQNDPRSRRQHSSTTGGRATLAPLRATAGPASRAALQSLHGTDGRPSSQPFGQSGATAKGRRTLSQQRHGSKLSRSPAPRGGRAPSGPSDQSHSVDEKARGGSGKKGTPSRGSPSRSPRRQPFEESKATVWSVGRQSIRDQYFKPLMQQERSEHDGGGDTPTAKQSRQQQRPSGHGDGHPRDGDLRDDQQGCRDEKASGQKERRLRPQDIAPVALRPASDHSAPLPGSELMEPTDSSRIHGRDDPHHRSASSQPGHASKSKGPSESKAHPKLSDEKKQRPMSSSSKRTDTTASSSALGKSDRKETTAPGKMRSDAAAALGGDGRSAKKATPTKPQATGHPEKAKNDALMSAASSSAVVVSPEKSTRSGSRPPSSSLRGTGTDKTTASGDSPGKTATKPRPKLKKGEDPIAAQTAAKVKKLQQELQQRRMRERAKERAALERNSLLPAFVPGGGFGPSPTSDPNKKKRVASSSANNGDMKTTPSSGEFSMSGKPGADDDATGSVKSGSPEGQESRVPGRRGSRSVGVGGSLPTSPSVDQRRRSSVVQRSSVAESANATESTKGDRKATSTPTPRGKLSAARRLSAQFAHHESTPDSTPKPEPSNARRQSTPTASAITSPNRRQSYRRTESTLTYDRNNEAGDHEGDGEARQVAAQQEAVVSLAAARARMVRRLSGAATPSPAPQPTTASTPAGSTAVENSPLPKTADTPRNEASYDEHVDWSAPAPRQETEARSKAEPTSEVGGGLQEETKREADIDDDESDLTDDVPLHETMRSQPSGQPPVGVDALRPVSASEDQSGVRVRLPAITSASSASRHRRSSRSPTSPSSSKRLVAVKSTDGSGHYEPATSALVGGRVAHDHEEYRKAYHVEKSAAAKNDRKTGLAPDSPINARQYGSSAPRDAVKKLSEGQARLRETEREIWEVRRRESRFTYGGNVAYGTVSAGDGPGAGTARSGTARSTTSPRGDPSLSRGASPDGKPPLSPRQQRERPSSPTDETGAGGGKKKTSGVESSKVGGAAEADTPRRRRSTAVSTAVRSDGKDSSPSPAQTPAVHSPSRGTSAAARRLPRPASSTLSFPGGRGGGMGSGQGPASPDLLAATVSSCGGLGASRSQVHRSFEEEQGLEAYVRRRKSKRLMPQTLLDLSQRKRSSIALPGRRRGDGEDGDDEESDEEDLMPEPTNFGAMDERHRAALNLLSSFSPRDEEDVNLDMAHALSLAHTQSQSQFTLRSSDKATDADGDADIGGEGNAEAQGSGDDVEGSELKKATSGEQLTAKERPKKSQSKTSTDGKTPRSGRKEGKHSKTDRKASKLTGDQQRSGAGEDKRSEGDLGSKPALSSSKFPPLPHGGVSVSLMSRGSSADTKRGEKKVTLENPPPGGPRSPDGTAGGGRQELPPLHQSPPRKDSQRRQSVAQSLSAGIAGASSELLQDWHSGGRGASAGTGRTGATGTSKSTRAAASDKISRRVKREERRAKAQEQERWRAKIRDDFDDLVRRKPDAFRWRDLVLHRAEVIKNTTDKQLLKRETDGRQQASISKMEQDFRLTIDAEWSRTLQSLVLKLEGHRRRAAINAMHRELREAAAYAQFLFKRDHQIRLEMFRDETAGRTVMDVCSAAVLSVSRWRHRAQRRQNFRDKEARLRQQRTSSWLTEHAIVVGRALNLLAAVQRHQLFAAEKESWQAISTAAMASEKAAHDRDRERRAIAWNVVGEALSRGFLDVIETMQVRKTPEEIRDFFSARDVEFFPIVRAELCGEELPPLPVKGPTSASPTNDDPLDISEKGKTTKAIEGSPMSDGAASPPGGMSVETANTPLRATGAPPRELVKSGSLDKTNQPPVRTPLHRFKVPGAGLEKTTSFDAGAADGQTKTPLGNGRFAPPLALGPRALSPLGTPANAPLSLRHQGSGSTAAATPSPFGSTPMPAAPFDAHPGDEHDADDESQESSGKKAIQKRLAVPDAKTRAMFEIAKEAGAVAYFQSAPVLQWAGGEKDRARRAEEKRARQKAKQDAERVLELTSSDDEEKDNAKTSRALSRANSPKSPPPQSPSPAKRSVDTPTAGEDGVDAVDESRQWAPPSAEFYFSDENSAARGEHLSFPALHRPMETNSAISASRLSVSMTQQQRLSVSQQSGVSGRQSMTGVPAGSVGLMGSRQHSFVGPPQRGPGSLGGGAGLNSSLLNTASVNDALGGSQKAPSFMIGRSRGLRSSPSPGRTSPGSIGAHGRTNSMLLSSLKGPVSQGGPGSLSGGSPSPGLMTPGLSASMGSASGSRSPMQLRSPLSGSAPIIGISGSPGGGLGSSQNIAAGLPLSQSGSQLDLTEEVFSRAAPRVATAVGANLINISSQERTARDVVASCMSLVVLQALRDGTEGAWSWASRMEESEYAELVDELRDVAQNPALRGLYPAPDVVGDWPFDVDGERLPPRAVAFPQSASSSATTRQNSLRAEGDGDGNVKADVDKLGETARGGETTTSPPRRRNTRTGADDDDDEEEFTLDVDRGAAHRRSNAAETETSASLALSATKVYGGAALRPASSESVPASAALMTARPPATAAKDGLPLPSRRKSGAQLLAISSGDDDDDGGKEKHRRPSSAEARTLQLLGVELSGDLASDTASMVIERALSASRPTSPEDTRPIMASKTEGFAAHGARHSTRASNHRAGRGHRPAPLNRSDVPPGRTDGKHDEDDGEPEHLEAYMSGCESIASETASFAIERALSGSCPTSPELRPHSYAVSPFAAASDRRAPSSVVVVRGRRGRPAHHDKPDATTEPASARRQPHHRARTSTKQVKKTSVTNQADDAMGSDDSGYMSGRESIASTTASVVIDRALSRASSPSTGHVAPSGAAAAELLLPPALKKAEAGSDKKRHQPTVSAIKAEATAGGDGGGAKSSPTDAAAAVALEDAGYHSGRESIASTTASVVIERALSASRPSSPEARRPSNRSASAASRR